MAATSRISRAATSTSGTRQASSRPSSGTASGVRANPPPVVGPPCTARISIDPSYLCLLGHHPHRPHAVAEERRQGGQEIDQDSPHPLDRGGAVVDVAGQPDPDRVEDHAVAEGDQINARGTHRHSRPRRVFEPERHAEGPRSVVAGAEREDRELPASRAMQTFCRLADRAVPAGNHDALDAVSNRGGSQLGGMAGRFGEDHRRGQAPIGQSLRRLRPLTTQPATRRRRIDDDPHLDSLANAAAGTQSVSSSDARNSDRPTSGPAPVKSPRRVHLEIENQPSTEVNMFEFAIVVLFALAISDLVVGVSNDAVNFLNSSIGSKVTSRNVIMVIASLGMLAGVTFSSGMMEVARKGIFHPQFFTMPELMTIFLAVMLTDIILLDLYNTFGLPTSTTVSIVFELLGAAVAVSLLKISAAGAEHRRSRQLHQHRARRWPSFPASCCRWWWPSRSAPWCRSPPGCSSPSTIERRLKRYGALWGGAALAAITYFILIKGSKGASFITPETLAWIKGNTGTILLGSFVVSAVLLQLLAMVARVNPLKVVVLVGTFALAMAFAANDLVNFIGVPLAGLSSYTVANATADPSRRDHGGADRSRFSPIRSSCSSPASSWSSLSGSPARRGP